MVSEQLRNRFETKAKDPIPSGLEHVASEWKPAPPQPQRTMPVPEAQREAQITRMLAMAARQACLLFAAAVAKCYNLDK